MLFTIFHLILFVLLTPTNYCFHDKVLLPLLEIPPILVLHLVVIFHIFCNLANCHHCYNFTTYSVCPTHSNQLLFSQTGSRVYLS